jgi:hypothetical protein
MRQRTIRNIISLAILASVTACGLNSAPGTTEKVGQIVKVSKVGILNKTWEAELVRGGFSNGGGVNGTAYDFTIESDSLAKVAQDFMEAQREVRVKARHEGIYLNARTESHGHFATSIDSAAKK